MSSNTVGRKKRFRFLKANSIDIFFLLITSLIVLGSWNTPALKTLAINFFAIILEAFPFMLLGALVGGLVEGFLSREVLVGFFSKRGTILPVLIGASVGLIFPVCECAIVVVIRRLLKKGTPIGAAIAYLISGPIFNPIVGFSTWVAYGYDFKVVIIRLFSGVSIAILIGYVTNLIFKNRNVLSFDTGASCGHTHHNHHHHHHAHDHEHGGERPSFHEKLDTSIVAANEDFFGVGKYLVIGAFIAALSQSLLSREGLVGWMTNPTLAILLMMIMAILLNLCSESDAFIAAAFRGTSMPMSAQMAFMVLGPMLDLKLVIMYMGVFKKRFILYLVPFIFISVFAVVYLLHVLGGFK